MSDSVVQDPTAHASFGRRAVAVFIDALVVSVITSALTSGITLGMPGLAEPIRLAVPDPFGWLTMNGLVWVVYDTVLHARTGRTLGKSILGIAVRTDEGATLPFGRALVRSLMKFTVSAWVLYLGWLWAAWDPNGQTWHDKLARSSVRAAVPRQPLTDPRPDPVPAD